MFYTKQNLTPRNLHHICAKNRTLIRHEQLIGYSIEHNEWEKHTSYGKYFVSITNAEKEANLIKK